jgi:hypothetical protein
MVRLVASVATLFTVADAKAILNFIRHGEKECEPSVDLSPEGEDRAQYLAKCMSTSTLSRGMPMGKATKVYASTQVEGHTKRPIQTATPIANAAGVQLQTPCLKNDYDCFAKEVAKLSDGETMIVSWTNDEMPDLLATALAGSSVDIKSIVGHDLSLWTHDCPSPVWPEPECSASGKTCYDEIWQVIFENGKAVDFKMLREGFEGNPTGSCTGDLIEDTGVVTLGGSCQLGETCAVGLSCQDSNAYDGKHPVNKICMASQTVV